MKIRERIALFALVGILTAGGTSAYIPKNNIAAYASSETMTYGDFEYELSSYGGVAITKYNGSDQNVVVPDTIGAFNVTEIAYPAFNDNRNIVTVKLPETVVKIGASTFWNCRNLKEINMPKCLELVDLQAFSQCDLRKIEFNDNLKTIGTLAFQLNVYAKYIEIPSSVDTIEEKAFNNCRNVRSVCIINGVKTIGDYAFNGLDNVDWVYIPPSVTSIGKCAFGYTYYYEYEKISNENFTIFGAKGSAAETYAAENDIIFRECVFGDPSLDGIIDAVDASEVLSEYAKNSTGAEGEYGYLQNSLADVNMDSVIDAIDASYILSYYAYTATGGTMTLAGFMSQ